MLAPSFFWETILLIESFLLFYFADIRLVDSWSRELVFRKLPFIFPFGR